MPQAQQPELQGRDADDEGRPLDTRGPSLGVGSVPPSVPLPPPGPPSRTLNVASMCSTTGQGESLISHSRSWLVGPGTPPVNFNSKSSTSLAAGGGGERAEKGSRGRFPGTWAWPSLTSHPWVPGCCQS